MELPKTENVRRKPKKKKNRKKLKDFGRNARFIYTVIALSVMSFKKKLKLKKFLKLTFDYKKLAKCFFCVTASKSKPHTTHHQKENLFILMC